MSSAEPRPASVPTPLIVGPSDGALIERIRAGDHAAFEVVFRSHHALLRAVAARLSTPALAEELVQDVMFSLWERRATLDVQADLRAYLLSAIRFRAASAVRHGTVTQRHADAVRALHPPPAPADAALLADERARAVAAAIDRLPERCRLIFILVRVEGLSYADASAALGISVRTVDAQMGNALRRLRDDLRALRR